MKLLLMRHAHTEQSPEKQDFERILTDQGQAEAMEAANFLDSYRIDKMIVSYVKRTLQTANIIEEQIPISENEVVKELYNGTRENMIELLSNQEDTNDEQFKLKTILYVILYVTNRPNPRPN